MHWAQNDSQAGNPDANYHGPGSFTITVSDGNGGTVDVIVRVTVTPVNDQTTVETSSPLHFENVRPVPNADSGMTAKGVVIAAAYYAGSL